MSDSADRKQNTDDPQGSASRTDRKRREISGPGASDFLAAPGGLDLPESDPAKGMRAASPDERPILGEGAEGVAPQLDERVSRGERRWEGEERRKGEAGRRRNEE